MSFLLDPGLLVASGVGIGALAPDEQSATAAEVGTMALFWGVSVSLWQDRRWIAWAPPLLGSESGRDFMLNSGALNLGVPLRFDASRRDLRRDLAAAKRAVADPQRCLACIDRSPQPSPVDRQRTRPRRRGAGYCWQRWL